MPNATVNLEDVEKFPLKSLEGGEVTIRRLSYGAWLKRQEMAMQMKIHGMDKKNPDTEIQSMQKQVAQFEFSHCIVDHNLEDAAGNKLDFSKPHTLDILSPKVGNEIGRYIAELHEFEDDLGNSPAGLTTS